MKHFSLILFISFVATGCGFAPPYLKVEDSLRSGNFIEAAKVVEENQKAYGDKSLLLYYFDRVWAEHLAGNHKISNEYAEKANQLIDILYTKSVSTAALAFLGNDMSLPYVGENFERVMLHTVAMLNYAMLGDVSGALVEARRADERMQQYAEKAGKGQVVYSQDALSRYLSAVLYESEGGQARWDAFIDYKKADEAYGLYAKSFGTSLPTLLKADLLRISGKLGEKDAQDSYSKRFGPLALPETKGKGQLLVLFYEGMSPVKVSENVNIPIQLDDKTQQFFSVAFPRFVPRLTGYASASVSVGGAEKVPLELFQDIQSIAIQDLQDRVALIRLKAIARGTAKFQAARLLQQKAREQGGDGAMLLAILGTNLYGLISEQADTRSWRTLPGRIWLTRLYLEPGKHNLKLLVTAQSQVFTKDFENVEVKAGKVSFVAHSVY